MRALASFAAALITASTALPAVAETIHVGVNGLVCAFCAAGLEKQFRTSPAIQTIAVDLDKKQVTLTTRGDASLSDATIRTMVDDAGYTPTTITRAP